MSTHLHFDEDVTLEILSWLPAKEIVRLRCVSRRWRSLLSDPRFVAKHAARNPRPPASSFFLRDNFHHTEHFALVDPSASRTPGPVPSFPPACAGRDRVSVSASCNGLLVCCRATPGFYNFRYHICNPTTGESVELSLPEAAGCCLSLAFDPSRSSHYEVAAAGRRSVHVYSSRTRSWRPSVGEASLRELGGFHLLRGVYWDGQLVWVGKECVMSLRAEEDRMEKLPAPAEPNSYDCSRVLYVGASGGKLQMITTSPGNEVLASTKIVILELGSSSSRYWSLLQHLDLVSIPRPICRASGSYAQLARECREFSPVHFVEPEGVLLLSVPGKILSYGLKDGAFRKVCDVPTPPSGSFYCPYDWYKFFPLAETLFSP